MNGTGHDTTIISFSSPNQERVIMPLQKGLNQTLAGITALENAVIGGGTYMSYGLQKAVDEFAKLSDQSVKKGVMVLTDGFLSAASSETPRVTALLAQLEDLNTEIYTVGIGNNINRQQLITFAR